MESKTALPPFPLHLSPTSLLPPSSPGAPPAALTSRPFIYTESSPSIPWLATDDVVESNSPDVRRLFFYFVINSRPSLLSRLLLRSYFFLLRLTFFRFFDILREIFLTSLG